MTLQFRDVSGVYTVRSDDSDVVLSFQDAGGVEIPVDDGSIPIGFQTAVQATTAPVVVKANDGVTLGCPTAPFVKPYQTGVMVKTDANFWLLSLGTSGGSGGAVPLPPVLIEATPGAGQISLVWQVSPDSGGSPVTNHIVELSEDNLVWKVDQVVGASDVSAVVAGLLPQTYWVRVKALNSEGSSDPSNVLSATPGASQIAAVHSASREFTITNYSPKYLYSIVAGAADISALPKVRMNPDSTVTLKASAGGVSDEITFTVKSYTYHQGNAECGMIRYVCGGCGCLGGNNCSCSTPTCQCACSTNCEGDPNKCGFQECSCNLPCPQVKDATPAGFVDEYGEWAKIGG